MRTTLTLDDDVAAKLASASRKSGKPFKQVVNAAIRRGLLEMQAARQSNDFAEVCSPVPKRSACLGKRSSPFCASPPTSGYSNARCR